MRYKAGLLPKDVKNIKSTRHVLCNIGNEFHALKCLMETRRTIKFIFNTIQYNPVQAKILLVRVEGWILKGWRIFAKIKKK